MYLKFGDSVVRVRVIDESSFPSKHTGSSLRRLKVKCTIEGQRNNEKFLSMIERAKAEGVTSVDEEGDVISKWKIGNTSWNYTQGTPIYYHTLEIEEVEELNLDYLVLGTMKLTPYVYKEWFHQDYLNIEAKVLLAEAEDRELRTMLKSSDYFQVIRYGVNEQPIEMRFGNCYWSRHDEGIKHELTLVGKEFDETSNPITKALLWMKPMKNRVAENTATIDMLLNALADKKILTPEEIEQVRSDALENHWNVRHEFFKVEDVDDL